MYSDFKICNIVQTIVPIQIPYQFSLLSPYFTIYPDLYKALDPRNPTICSHWKRRQNLTFLEPGEGWKTKQKRRHSLQQIWREPRAQLWHIKQVPSTTDLVTVGYRTPFAWKAIVPPCERRWAVVIWNRVPNIITLLAVGSTKTGDTNGWTMRTSHFSEETTNTIT